MKTQWLEENQLLRKEPAEDVLKFLEYGVSLTTQLSGISASLRMLHLIECYTKVIDRRRLTDLIDRLLDNLARNVWPASQARLYFAHVLYSYAALAFEERSFRHHCPYR